MSAPNDIETSREMLHALLKVMTQGEAHASLINLVIRLLIEVEALRHALSHPDMPESVRQAYRQAYEQIAELSHNAAGSSGGLEKVLSHFVPKKASAGRFAAERMMMVRLGASKQDIDALCERLEEVESFT